MKCTDSDNSFHSFFLLFLACFKIIGENLTHLKANFMVKVSHKNKIIFTKMGKERVRWDTEMWM